MHHRLLIGLVFLVPSTATAQQNALHRFGLAPGRDAEGQVSVRSGSNDDRAARRFASMRAPLRVAQAPGERDQSGTSGPVDNTLNELRQIQAKIDELSRRFNELTGIVENNTKSILQLRADLQGVTEQLSERLVREQQILEAISRQDTSGNRILRLNSIMDKSPEFADEVKQAVGRSLQQEGTLRITNRTGINQQVEVNAITYTVMPGDQNSITVKVRTGTVTTRLLGQSMVNWTVGPPRYHQSIKIVERHITARPITSSTTSTMGWRSSPVYVSPGTTVFTWSRPYEVFYPVWP